MEKTVYFIAALLASPMALGADAKLGQLKSPSCQFCHTANGASEESYPILNGQNESYLFNTMKAYQQGNRTGPLGQMMQAQLQRLNDDDLKDIAAFYSNQVTQAD